MQILILYCPHDGRLQQCGVGGIQCHVAVISGHAVDKSNLTIGVICRHLHHVLLVGDVPNLRRCRCTTHNVALRNFVIGRVYVAEIERVSTVNFQLALDVHFEIIEPRHAASVRNIVERNIARFARVGREFDRRCGEACARSFVNRGFIHRFQNLIAYQFTIHAHIHFVNCGGVCRCLDEKIGILSHDVRQRFLESVTRFCAVKLFAVPFATRTCKVSQIFFVNEIVGKCGDVARWRGGQRLFHLDAATRASVGGHKVVTVVRVGILRVSEKSRHRVFP